MSADSRGDAAVFTAARIAEIITPEGEETRLPTPEQSAIIEQPVDGSVLVIAGAGSGKTETMANRVVWLVANGLVEPTEILGLTFTRKAAGELNERVAQRLMSFAANLEDLQSLGHLSAFESGRATSLRELLADGLDLPEVSTYNAFASGVLREFGAIAGVAVSSDVIDAPTAWGIAREVVTRSIDTDLAVSDFQISTLVKKMLELDHSVSDNLTSFEAVEEAISRFEVAGEWSYADKRGKTPYSGVMKAVADVGSTRVIARLASEFAAEKRTRGLIEFSDQLALAVETLARAPEAVRVLRQRTPVVLLDEVQDTSVGQTRLLSTLFAGNSVMAVGDPHQSIYGFRGASASNMLSFHRDFAASAVGRDGEPGGDGEPHGEGATGRTLNLTVSWRNPTEVLQAANQISEPLATKLQQLSRDTLTVPKLMSRTDYAQQQSQGARNDDDRGENQVNCVEWRFAETVDDEFAELAAWMAEARQEHLGRRGTLPSAAVVFSKRKFMPAVQSALQDAGVPCRIVGLGGLLSTPEITDLVSALRCLWYADAGSELIRILTGPRFSIGVKDIDGLRQVARWFAERDSDMQPVGKDELPANDASLGRALPDPDRQVTLLDAVDEIAGMKRLDRPSLKNLSETGRVRIREAGQMFRRLRQGIGGNLLELLRAVTQELRLDIELDANEREGHLGAAAARANLESFSGLLENFLLTDTQGTLVSALEWLEQAAESDDVAEHVPEPEPGTVQLITAHGAKGLEWDLVAIPRLVDGEFPSGPRDGVGWLRAGQLPDELRGDIAARPRLDWRWLQSEANQKTLDGAIKVYQGQLKERHADEQRRLAYVAVTRAASRLLLTGAWWNGNKTPSGPSVFLRELADVEIIGRLPESSAYDEDPNATSGRTLRWPLDPLGSRADAVTRAASAVRAAIGEEVSQDASIDPTIDPTVELLLAEQESTEAASVTGKPPERITASTFHEFVESPLEAERNRLRPIPIRPYRRTRIGNLFHEWVERRATTALGTAVMLPGFEPGLGSNFESNFESAFESDSGSEIGSEIDSDFDRTLEDGFVGDPSTEAELQVLIEQFEKSRWADRQPIAVELEVNLPFAGRNLACKLDAVYRNEAEDGSVRYEVVDWKSGRPPRNKAERDSRFLQLDLYRHAYSQWVGVDPETVDVTLYYVADGEELRGEGQRTFEELEQLWLEAAETAEGPNSNRESTRS